MIISVLMLSNPLSLSLPVNATLPYSRQFPIRKPLKNETPIIVLLGPTVENTDLRPLPGETM